MKNLRGRTLRFWVDYPRVVIWLFGLLVAAYWWGWKGLLFAAVFSLALTVRVELSTGAVCPHCVLPLGHDGMHKAL